MPTYMGYTIEPIAECDVVAVEPPFVKFSNGGSLNLITGKYSGPGKIEEFFSISPSIPTWTPRVFCSPTLRIPEIRRVTLGSLPFADIVVQPYSVAHGLLDISAKSKDALGSIRQYIFMGELTLSMSGYTYGQYDVQSTFHDDWTQKALINPPTSTVTVLVPYGTSVYASGCFNSLIIGDIGGDVVLDLAGIRKETADGSANNIHVGAVKNATITNSGTSRIHVAAATETSQLVVNQSGGIHIGNLEKHGHKLVNIRTFGSGDLSIDGAVEKAIINHSGTGFIQIDSVVYKPTITANVTNSIYIGNWNT